MHEKFEFLEVYTIPLKESCTYACPIKKNHICNLTHGKVDIKGHYHGNFT